MHCFGDMMRGDGPPTGETGNDHFITAAVTAIRVPRDMTNNDRSGQVTVGVVAPPPEPEESSGSGAFGWLSLLILLGLLWGRIQLIFRRTADLS